MKNVRLFSAVLLPGMTRYRAPASLFEKVLPAPTETPPATPTGRSPLRQQPDTRP